MSCMHGNDLKTIKCHEECKIISYEAMKFVRNVLVLHCKVLPNEKRRKNKEKKKNKTKDYLATLQST